MVNVSLKWSVVSSKPRSCLLLVFKQNTLLKHALYAVWEILVKEKNDIQKDKIMTAKRNSLSSKIQQ